jgi:hypothetical protein
MMLIFIIKTDKDNTSTPPSSFGKTFFFKKKQTRNARKNKAGLRKQNEVKLALC